MKKDVDSFVFKNLPNERLFEFAVVGSEKALLSLFQGVKFMWRSNTPKDTTGLNDYEDWVCIGDEEFFLKWKAYDLQRGVKFSTWIFSVVRNRWRVEINKSRSFGRKTNDDSVVCHYNVGEEDFVLLSADDFFSFGKFDNGYVEIFYNRFRKHVAENLSDNALAVFDMKFYIHKFTIPELARLLGLTASSISGYISDIKLLALDFVKIERSLNVC